MAKKLKQFKVGDVVRYISNSCPGVESEQYPIPYGSKLANAPKLFENLITDSGSKNEFVVISHQDKNYQWPVLVHVCQAADFWDGAIGTRNQLAADTDESEMVTRVRLYAAHPNDIEKIR